ncbi:MAG TPA: non-heme iron oxygenase ferredoxin subunit [Actinomycetota bacterium]|nr:non-heme iron oxygenase ferredoxin subunit [Actinomycetota bacterium]
MTGVRVCSIDEVPVGEVMRVEVGGRPIALVNLGDEGFRAVDAICSHAHYFLDEGEVDAEDETIECPKHGSVFDLNTGRPRSLPATLPVETFAVTAVDHDILIEVTNGE